MSNPTCGEMAGPPNGGQGGHKEGGKDGSFIFVIWVGYKKLGLKAHDERNSGTGVSEHIDNAVA